MASTLTQDKLKRLKEIFTGFDTNRDGSVCCKEFKAVMIAMGINVSDEEAQELIDSVDKDDNRKLNFEEFLDMVAGFL